MYFGYSSPKFNNWMCAVGTKKLRTKSREWPKDDENTVHEFRVRLLSRASDCFGNQRKKSLGISIIGEHFQE